MRDRYIKPRNPLILDFAVFFYTKRAVLRLAQRKKMMNTFTTIGLNKDILKGLSTLKFKEPTPVQAQVIPLVLEQKVDLVGLAQTGTGKTAAFGLPLIQRTNPKSKQTQWLVLCPTRELCVQVTKDLEAYSRYVEGIRILAVYGGASIEKQIRALRKGVQIIVATPGRLNDLINRRKVDLSSVSTVVIDEADELLQMGFQEELNAILSETPKTKNTLLFSATMPREVAAIARKNMSDPVEITVGKRNAGAANVRHESYMVHANNRYPALKRIVDHCPTMYAIIFCRTRIETHKVANQLIQDGYNADALHGDLSQAQRDRVMNKFRSKRLQLLVATDVAARGLDVNDLTHVINYNLPDDLDGYTHRSGRTGRAGRAGISVALIHMNERFRIRAIEKKINKKFKACRVPSGEAICKTHLVNLIDQVSKVDVDHDQLDPIIAEISEKLQSMNREELIKRLVSLAFNRVLDEYKNAPDLNAPVLKARDTKARKKSKKPSGQRNRPVYTTAHIPNPRQQFTRFALNVGRRQGIVPQGLIGQINRVPGVGRIKVGKIEILRNKTLIEADSRFTPQVLAAFKNTEIKGKPVTIKVAPGSSGPKRRRHPHKKRKAA